MRSSKSSITLLTALLASVWIVGCSGSGEGSNFRITGTLPSSGTVTVAYGPATLTASGGSGADTWTVTGLPSGVTVQGSLMASSITVAGTPTTADPFDVAVSVTDSASHTATYNVTVTISAPGALTVTTTSLPGGTVGTVYDGVSLAATGGFTPYTWSVKSGGAPPAGLTFAASGAISGTPTAAGTFGPYVFTVTDHNNTTADSPSISIVIAAAAAAACMPNPAPRGNEAALTAPYAFVMAGSDVNNIPVSMAGSFTPNSEGGITTGFLDFVTDQEVLTLQVTGGSYSYGADGRGCVTLGIASATAIAHGKRLPIAANASRTRGHGRRKATTTRRPAGSSGGTDITTFSFVLGQTNKSGSVESFDLNVFDVGLTSLTAAVGNIHVQTQSDFSREKFAGHFAFGAAGWFTDSEFIDRTAIAGTVTNTNGTLSNSFADVNIDGDPSGELSGGSGTLGNVDEATGRGEGSYTILNDGDPFTFNFVFYVVNHNDFFILSDDDPDQLGALQLTGRAIASNSTPPVPNGFYMFGASGYDVDLGGNVAAVGTAHLTNANAVPTATIYQNDAGQVGTKTFTDGSYALETVSGRISLTLVGTQPPVAYETADNSEDDIVAFLVGTDPAASSGILMLQSTTAPNFGAAQLTGNFGLASTEYITGISGTIVGAFTFNGANQYTAIADSVEIPGNEADQTLFPNESFNGTTQTNQDGSGVFDGGAVGFVTNGTYLLAFDADGSQPFLYVAVKQ